MNKFFYTFIILMGVTFLGDNILSMDSSVTEATFIDNANKKINEKMGSIFTACEGFVKTAETTVTNLATAAEDKKASYYKLIHQNITNIAKRFNIQEAEIK